MDTSEVKKIINDNIKFIRWALQLQLWDIDLTYDHVREDGDKIYPANCQPFPEYRILKIKINPLEEEDEDDVITDLLHEMLHGLTCSFETYRKAVYHLVSEK